MVVKKTHHTLQLIFALFVAYLLVTRLLISWVQMAPEQVVSVAEWMLDSEISFKRIEIEQNWLGFQLQVEEINIQDADYEFQAQFLDVDVNVFSPLVPSLDYGAYLQIEEGALQFKNVQATELKEQPDVLQLNFKELTKLDVDISRLWQRVKVKDFILSEIVRPGLSVQIHDFQSLKGAQLSMASEFGLAYKGSLNYEKFSFKATLNPNVWGGIEHGDFSLSSFQPLRAERMALLLPEIWHTILPKGELILDLKVQIAQSKLAKLILNLNGQSLQWQQAHSTLPKSMGLELVWASEHQNIRTQFSDWHFKLSKLQLDNRYIETVSPIELYFEANQMLNFSSSYFDIEPFKVILKSLVLNKHVAALFDNAAQLTISDVKGQLNWQTLEVPLLQVKLDKLSIPVTDYPGLAIQNLTILKQTEFVSLQTNKPVWIMQPDIHENPMRFDLPSKVMIGYDSGSEHWVLSNLQAKVDDIPIKFSVSGDAKGDVDATLNINVKSMVLLKSYLPYSFMAKDLQSWLQASLVGGEKIAVDVMLKGNLADFPFENGEGVFKAVASVENARLKFNKDWPMLQDFAARIEFTPFQLKITADDIDVGAGVRVRDVQVIIPDLDKHDIALNIQGKADAKLNHAIHYLMLSPLASKLGLKSFLQDNARLSGDVSIMLENIWVPISGYEAEPERVKGTLEFKRAALTLQDQLTLKNIQGTLAFTEKQVASKKIEAGLLGGNGVFKVGTNSKTKVVEINGRGVSQEENSHYFEKPLPWNAAIQVPFQNSPVKGVSAKFIADVSVAKSLLPAPFDKQALSGKKITVQASILENSLSIKGELPGLIDLNGRWIKDQNKFKFEKLQVVLGEKGRQSLPLVSKVSSVTGKLDSVDLDGWIALYKEAPIEKSFKEEKTHVNWQASNLEVASVLLWAKDYHDLHIGWKTVSEDSVALNIKSPSVDAKLKTDQNGVWKLDVKHLKIYTMDSDKTSLIDVPSDSKICEDKKQAQGLFPEVLFTGKNIYIDDRKIDSLSFDIKDSNNQLVLSGLRGSFGNKSGSLMGNYLFDKSALISKFELQIHSKNVAAVTDFLKLKKGFSGKQARVGVELDWAGGITCFSKKQAKGSVDFELKEGSIEDIEPGFARLIGLLSVESLARRLKLDMKDVTNKGMVYDSINGKAILSKGSLQLESFRLKAPAATAKLFGKVDLLQEQFNLRASVTPEIGSSIPTVAAIVGGANPLAALAVYSLMKIIPGINENLITYKYEITGPWLNPKVTEVKAKSEVDVPGVLRQDSVLDIQ